MKGAGGRGPIADVHETDAILAAELEREGDASHDGHHVAEVRDLADETATGVAEVDVELAAAGRGIAPGHVLAEDLERRRALHEHGAEIPDERRQHVPGLERKGRSDGIRFLAERAEKAAHDLRLAIQIDQPLFERAGEPHPVIELEQLVAREGGRMGRSGRGARGGQDMSWTVTEPANRGENSPDARLKSSRRRNFYLAAASASSATAVIARTPIPMAPSSARKVGVWCPPDVLPRGTAPSLK